MAAEEGSGSVGEAAEDCVERGGGKDLWNPEGDVSLVPCTAEGGVLRAGLEAGK